jgi:hypothetical protein
MAAGTAHGFVLFDYAQKKVLLDVFSPLARFVVVIIVFRL